MKVFKKITAAVTAATMLACGNIGVLPKEAVRDFMLSASAENADIVASGEFGDMRDNLTNLTAQAISTHAETTIIQENERTSSVEFWAGDIIKPDIEPFVVWSNPDLTGLSCEVSEPMTVCEVLGDNIYGVCISNVDTPYYAKFFMNDVELIEKQAVKLRGAKAIIFDGPKSEGEIRAEASYDSEVIGYLEPGQVIEHFTPWDSVNGWIKFTDKDNVDKFVNLRSYRWFTIQTSSTTTTTTTKAATTTTTTSKETTTTSTTTTTGKNDIVASGECGAEGDNLTWSLDGEGTLTISGTGPMETVAFGIPEWKEWRSDIKKVVIEDGVTAISTTAFNGCPMSEIEIADSVESIGRFAFGNCIFLTELVLPEGLKEISLYAFTGCDLLTSVTIPENVSVIEDGIFYGCMSLTEIDVNEKNKNYTSVDGVLYTKDMTQLVAYPVGKKSAEFVVPDGVRKICGGTFGGSSSLTNVTISDSVTTIGDEAFSDCSVLKLITIPQNVAEIEEYAFSNCSSLESIIFESSDCNIYDGSYTICNSREFGTGDEKYIGYFDGTIYGYEGSTAQAYAEKYGRKFVALDKTEDIPCDITGDGIVSASDATLVLSAYTVIGSGSKSPLTEAQTKAADVDKDGIITGSDATLILRYSTKLSSLTPGETVPTFEEWYNSQK